MITWCTRPGGLTRAPYQGKKIMAESVQTLAKLGLSKATKVLLTGFAAAGQQVYLTADTFHAAVKVVAPGLKVCRRVFQSSHASAPCSTY